MSTRNELLEQILSSIVAGTPQAPTRAYLGYQQTTEQTLTTTPNLNDDFVATIAPVGFTYSAGRFTIDDIDGGIYQIELERIYKNYDQSPSVAVNATLDIQLNGVSAFNRTLEIPSANSPNEPGIAPLTTSLIIELSDGDYVEVYSSAEDDGASPVDCRLSLLKATAHKIFAS